MEYNNLFDFFNRDRSLMVVKVDEQSSGDNIEKKNIRSRKTNNKKSEDVNGSKEVSKPVNPTTEGNNIELKCLIDLLKGIEKDMLVIKGSQGALVSAVKDIQEKVTDVKDLLEEEDLEEEEITDTEELEEEDLEDPPIKTEAKRFKKC